MKKSALLLLCLLLAGAAFGQKWVAQTYTIQTTPDVAYGTATDFAGNLRTLRMDIAVPTDDVPPPCGRPLLIAVHGGAFLGGDKSEATLQAWMKDFARRGYVAASVNYRLGMFQTHHEVHCNVTQLFNTAWDCSNMADTAEWYRGAYRAMQDVRGAIRYLVNRRADYQIDPQNVFLVGESAGGFTVLNVAYMDSPAEKPAAAYALPDVPPPHPIYESTCVQAAQWDTSIASMQLKRPDLGPVEGTLNPSNTPYTLRGVGNFYGATLGNLFSENTYPEPPALYMFHQPNDLIVPFGTHRALIGYSYCFTGLGCAYLINTPYVNGSAAIKKQIDQLKNAGKKVPEYVFDATSNTADCTLQVLNPALTGHSIDNYTIRTGNLAKLFASKLYCDTLCDPKCLITVGTNAPVEPLPGLVVSPNPARDVLTVTWSGPAQVLSAALVDATGRIVFQKNDPAPGVAQFQMPLPVGLPNGSYALLLTTERGVVSRVVVRQ